jgi:NitT/TauT family transport system ATP-binding protein
MTNTPTDSVPCPQPAGEVILDKRGGRDDLPELARLLTFEVDDLLPIVDAVEILGLATVADADIELTPPARRWSKPTS